MNHPEVSSYLAHLPPALWREEQAGALGLGSMLRIFEKIATGIDDDVPLPALTDQIAGLHRIFDPWTTPPQFLPWLASWVALTFPTLQNEPVWDEYQRRKVTAGIAQVYRLRGRKAGLNRYLDLYAVGTTRPRICVDDGARLFAVTPRPQALATVEALGVQPPLVGTGKIQRNGITRPWCVTADSSGHLFVGDAGVPSIQVAPAPDIPTPSSWWRLDPSGRYPLTGTPPLPAPLNTGNLLTDIDPIAAVTVLETAYAITRSGRLLALPEPFTGTATVLTTLTNPTAPVWIVAMTLDPATGQLLVLDRGGRHPQMARPSLITVTPEPLTSTRTALPGLTEPLSLIARPDGTLLIGDGGPQEPDPGVPSQLTGNLFTVQRRTTPWTVTAQLPADPATNPLVSPTGLAELDGQLYVLDAGLKPFEPSPSDPFVCPVAEHAAIYHYSEGTLTRITEPGQFVFPTGLGVGQNRLLVADPGRLAVNFQPYLARVLPSRFDVGVHFTAARVPQDPVARKHTLQQAVGAISTIVNDQKPAHTMWSLTTSSE
ncbi:phage tail protein [Kineosporia babensis]|uniref:Phage tail protein n=1 Tax=Kineosporia babensis TaxID=499548 RepID=A0A9X1NJ22_9ACTN|nr:phage tail protein [Kineosporia babensis]MCD5315947.1 phage tail protein [Kineosporia babensis]